MTHIEWTDQTWNPVVGCMPVSPGCLNCYAATMARRLEAMGKPGYEPQAPMHHYDQLAEPIRIAEVRDRRAVFTGSVRLLEDRLTEPLRWRKPRRVFVCSMSDLFHDAVPFHFIDGVFAAMALTPQHTYQLLTKRPERMAEYLRSRISSSGDPMDNIEHEMERLTQYEGLIEGHEWPLPNVWLGTSVEDQQRADERIPQLLECTAAVRFLSCEPLLGPIRLLTGIYEMPPDGDRGTTLEGIHWVIVGGESGSRARPCDVAWIESIRDQCAARRVRCFVKQLGARPGYTDPSGDTVRRWGETRIVAADDGVRLMLRDRKGGDWSEWPEDLRVRQWPEVLS